MKHSLRKIRRERKHFWKPRHRKILERFQKDSSIIAIIGDKEIRSREELMHHLENIYLGDKND